MATLITIDAVVRSYLKDRPIIDYQAEAAKVAHLYGAGIIGDVRGPEFYKTVFVEIEDAEVVSIETVASK